MLVKLETENVKETEVSAELIRELMADDAKRGNWLILMHDDDEEAFVQIAFDHHPDGIDLEYRGTTTRRRESWRCNVEAKKN